MSYNTNGIDATVGSIREERKLLYRYRGTYGMHGPRLRQEEGLSVMRRIDSANDLGIGGSCSSKDLPGRCQFRRAFQGW